VAFSPDGSRLASGGSDGGLRLWDPVAGTWLATLGGRQGTVLSVAFSPDGSRLASGGSDGGVQFWDPVAGTWLATLEGHRGTVWSVAFSPDGSRLASGGEDGVVRLWDPKAGGKPAMVEDHHSVVLSVAFSPDGSRLASGGDHGVVRLCDPAAGAVLATLEGHRGTVWSVAFSPDGSRLASGGDAVRVTKLAGLPGAIGPIRQRIGRKVVPAGEPVGHQNDEVTSLAYSPEGRTLAAAHAGGYITLRPAQPGSSRPVVRLVELPEDGWAALHGEHQYELHGDPAGAFWWTAGLCRFEPGELDGYCVERLSSERWTGDAGSARSVGDQEFAGSTFLPGRDKSQ
jgi:WD40 repeat protein